MGRSKEPNMSESKTIKIYDKGSLLTSYDDANTQYKYENHEDEFWVPEFKDTPPRSPSAVSTNIMRDKWLGKTMEVSPRHNVRDLQLAVHFMYNLTVSIPPCQCPVCHIVCHSALEAEKQRMGIGGRQLVEHGPDKYTIYDKAKPWLRQHVQGCTNPRPLARRMPNMVTGCSAEINNVYRSKMLPPGKVIRDVKKMNAHKDFNSRRGGLNFCLFSSPRFKSKI